MPETTAGAAEAATGVEEGAASVEMKDDGRTTTGSCPGTATAETLKMEHDLSCNNVVEDQRRPAPVGRNRVSSSLCRAPVSPTTLAGKMAGPACS
ncbi:unnamed protein product, partial [Amoebophrya sp. A120]|eukprot:GSA120T00000165001.1